MADTKKPVMSEKTQRVFINTWNAAKNMPPANQEFARDLLRKKIAEFEDVTLDDGTDLMDLLSGQAMGAIDYPTGVLRTAALLPTGKITGQDIKDALIPFEGRPAPAAGAVRARGPNPATAAFHVSDFYPEAKGKWHDISSLDASNLGIDVFSDPFLLKTLATKLGTKFIPKRIPVPPPSAAAPAARPMTFSEEVEKMAAERSVALQGAPATKAVTPSMVQTPDKAIIHYTTPEGEARQVTVSHENISAQIKILKKDGNVVKNFDIEPFPNIPIQATEIPKAPAADISQKIAEEIPSPAAILDSEISPVLAQENKPLVDVDSRLAALGELKRTKSFAQTLPLKDRILAVANALGLTSDLTQKGIRGMGNRSYTSPPNMAAANEAAFQAKFKKTPPSDVLEKYGVRGSPKSNAVAAEVLVDTLMKNDMRDVIQRGMDIGVITGQELKTGFKEVFGRSFDEMKIGKRSFGRATESQQAEKILFDDLYSTYGGKKIDSLDLPELLDIKAGAQAKAKAAGMYVDPTASTGAKIQKQQEAKAFNTVASRVDRVIRSHLNSVDPALGDVFHEINGEVSSLLTGLPALKDTAAKLTVGNTASGLMAGGLAGGLAHAVIGGYNPLTWASAGLAGLVAANPTLRNMGGYYTKKSAPYLSPVLRSSLLEAYGEAPQPSPWQLLQKDLGAP